MSGFSSWSECLQINARILLGAAYDSLLSNPSQSSSTNHHTVLDTDSKYLPVSHAYELKWQIKPPVISKRIKKEESPYFVALRQTPAELMKSRRFLCEGRFGCWRKSYYSEKFGMWAVLRLCLHQNVTRRLCVPHYCDVIHRSDWKC